MDRRKFLIGIGGASLGGSALISTGAFSRIEAQRGVSIEVAEDPEAYLGLDKCDTPNGSYVHDDGDGHMAIFMDDQNPTIGDTPLGEGVNSDSRTWFDRVFQICNQGKQAVCVYIEDDEDWPVVEQDDDPDQDLTPYLGDRRVLFYPEDERDGSLIGPENHVLLEVGSCLCVGLRTNTKGLADGDELLDVLDNEIVIVADEECAGDNGEECVSCPAEGFEEGRIGEITFRNEGPEQQIVVSRDGEGPSNSLFDATVAAGAEFTVDGMGPPGTPDIEFYFGGSSSRAEIVQNGSTGQTYHTSCSEPIYAGQRLHDDDGEDAYDIVVVEAEHHEGAFTIC
ncbi:MAG: hypothetical protein ACOC42_03135 [Halobacteriota archaeon]